MASVAADGGSGSGHGDDRGTGEADPLYGLARAGWPERFEAWRGRLSGLLGPVARLIEHVGSTSVPGLAAKSSAAAREAYAAAKYEAAKAWRNDRPAYTEAKSDVILGILDQAQAWATATGWRIRD